MRLIWAQYSFLALAPLCVLLIPAHEETNAARRLWWHNRLISEVIYQDSIAEWQTVELKHPRTDYQLHIRNIGKRDFD